MNESSFQQGDADLYNENLRLGEGIDGPIVWVYAEIKWVIGDINGSIMHHGGRFFYKIFY